ncbi:hypothetical protein RRG08_024021 [Elysia crispata]|uniref:Uncharacterized protein n=1 Tax=Elysia crispata TaxID=231223 RepID=A0AAE1DB28_9GAST|nr:hypothetical protein RRG08_024021 [Elysia crispata]
MLDASNLARIQHNGLWLRGVSAEYQRSVKETCSSKINVLHFGLCFCNVHLIHMVTHGRFGGTSDKQLNELHEVKASFEPIYSGPSEPKQATRVETAADEGNL